MYQAVTGTVDLTGPRKGKRLSSWHFSNTGTAATIDLVDGVGGTVLARIQLPVGSTTPVSASQAYASPQGLIFPQGLSVVVTGGTIVGSVDLQ
jgi:hypothetical protein